MTKLSPATNTDEDQHLFRSTVWYSPDQT